MRKVLVIFLVVISFLATATTVKEFFPKGHVDWTNGVINVKARSQPGPGKMTVQNGYEDAFEEAFADYFMKARELVSGLRVDHQTMAGQILKSSEVVSLEIDRLIRQPRLRTFQYQPDGSVVIDAFLPIYGPQGIGSVLRGNALGAAMGNEPKEKPPFISWKNNQFRTPDGSFYTGLIVDARMVNLKPTLQPRLVDRKQTILYGDNTSVGPDFAKQSGLVTYVYTLEEAKRLTERVGTHPLIVNAIAASGAFKTDVVLFNKDVWKLKQANAIIPFLKVSGVVFVLKG